MRPTGQQDRALDGTHQKKEKELLRNEKSGLRKPVFVTSCHDLEVNKALFYKGFQTRKRAVLDVDDQSVVPVKNEVLTGNKTAGAVKQKKVYNFLSL